MNCRDVRDRLETEAAAPDPGEDPGIGEHLATCPSCRSFRAAVQEEDRVLRAVLAFSDLDAARVRELERRTFAAIAAGSDVSVAPDRLLLPVAAAVGGAVLVWITGIETEALQAQLRDALVRCGSLSGVSTVLIASLVSALLGRATGLLCRESGLREGGTK